MVAGDLATMLVVKALAGVTLHINLTLQEHQGFRTNATVCKVSDISFIMGVYEIIFFKVFEA